MKRSSSSLEDEPSSVSSRSMKRANTSLFSIATIIEDKDDEPNEGEMISRNHQQIKTSPLGSNVHLPLPLENHVTKGTISKKETSVLVSSEEGVPPAVSASNSPPSTPHDSLSETEDASSLDGFYIDDDTSEHDIGEVVPAPSTSSRAEALSSSFLPVSSSKVTIPRSNRKETVPAVVVSEQPIPVVSTIRTGEVIQGPNSFTAEIQKSDPIKVTNDCRTGIVFEAGEKHFDRHNKFHKERPLRIKSIRDYLQASVESFLDRCTIIGETVNDDVDDNGGDVSPEKAFLDDEDYLRVHLPGYMQRLDRLSNCKCHERLDREAEQFKSIYFTPDSVREAKRAASSLCRLVSDVVTDKLDNGFAVIRPPGHHAEPGLAGGYCVINNIAVAAAYAREKLGVKRILIVDWDVHHGNGTQSIFLNDPDVLYFSVHRYHGGNFYPFLQNGGPSVVGNDDGAGFNLNVGWNKKGMGDDEYLAVWEKLLMPVAGEFQPDLVLVSAGFDAAKGDLGECNVTPECFARLTRSLLNLADGKVVCTLEGGYVRSVLGRCVDSVVRTLLHRKSAELGIREMKEDRIGRGDADVLDCIDSSAAKSIGDTIAAHRMYWSCLRDEEVPVVSKIRKAEEEKSPV